MTRYGIIRFLNLYEDAPTIVRIESIPQIPVKIICLNFAFRNQVQKSISEIQISKIKYRQIGEVTLLTSSRSNCHQNCNQNEFPRMFCNGLKKICSIYEIVSIITLDEVSCFKNLCHNKILLSSACLQQCVSHITHFIKEFRNHMLYQNVSDFIKEFCNYMLFQTHVTA